MHDVYKQNPALGDAAALNSQLEEGQRKIEELQHELNKFEVCAMLLAFYHCHYLQISGLGLIVAISLDVFS